MYVYKKEVLLTPLSCSRAGFEPKGLHRNIWLHLLFTCELFCFGLPQQPLPPSLLLFSYLFLLSQHIVY
jgi:hypothetical protein